MPLSEFSDWIAYHYLRDKESKKHERQMRQQQVKSGSVGGKGGIHFPRKRL